MTRYTDTPNGPANESRAHAGAATAREPRATAFRTLGFGAALLIAAAAVAPSALATDEKTGNAGSDSGEADITRQVEETWTSIREFGAEKSDEAMKAGRGLVSEMESDLEALERESAETAEKGWAETLSTLRSLKEEAAKQADALGEAGDDAWQHASERFRETSRAFADTYEKAKRELSGDGSEDATTSTGDEGGGS